MKYLIWSIEHKAWWMPASKGYTSSREAAGRYEHDEAVLICCGANFWTGMNDQQAPLEAMVPEPEAA